MRPRLLGYPFLASLSVLTVIGSIVLGVLLLAGSSLHGESIGSAYGILLAPLFALVGSLVLLLVVAVPACALIRWIFEKKEWAINLRWVVIPFTGPVIFCLLAPAQLAMGEREIFLAVVWSFVLGVIISTHWLVYLIFDSSMQKSRPNKSVPFR